MVKIKLPKKSVHHAPISPRDISVPSAPTHQRLKSTSLKKTKSVSPVLARLKHSADKLNSTTDQTADMVREIEDYLSIECSIGFNASVEFLSSISALQETLGYRRIGKVFRIAVSHNEESCKGGNFKAWSDCSRAEKIESIKYLPDLIKAITNKVDDDIANAESASNTVAGVLNSLTGIEG